MSNTRPSLMERRSLTYSECAHTSGMADPDGLPQNSSCSGISSASQICSGIKPPGLANASMALRSASAISCRPAASS